jgi:hypothetical protein
MSAPIRQSGIHGQWKRFLNEKSYGADAYTLAMPLLQLQPSFG